MAQMQLDKNCNAADATLHTPVLEYYAKGNDFNAAIAYLKTFVRG